MNFWENFEEANVKFRKMNNIEIEGIQIIAERLGDNVPELESLPIRSRDFGFAYTSSSAYPMMNVTEAISFYHSELDTVLILSHFAMTESDMLVMVCEDGKEDYYYFEIVPSDY